MKADEQAAMLGNRVRKAFRKLHPLFEKRGVGAFRLYDRDIPEIRAVVDWYEGHLVVAGYEREQTRRTPGWLEAMAEGAAGAVGVPSDRVHLKTRRTRPREGERYAGGPRGGERIEVREHGLRFLCSLDDAIDTGLFPDHRETRRLVRAEARGAEFLNLFGYTGSFTCAAAAGGALRTCTVDASRRYLSWARDNLSLNALAAGEHEMVCGDVEEFFRPPGRRRFTLCVLDPPSFSDKGGRSLDVQRDHPRLVELALRALAPGGVLYFSTNHQRFQPRLEPFRAEEITARTVPEDYRNRTAHRCFRIVAA